MYREHSLQAEQPLPKQMNDLASSLDGCLNRLVKKCDNANRRSEDSSRSTDILHQKLDELRVFNHRIRQIKVESERLRVAAVGPPDFHDRIMQLNDQQEISNRPYLNSLPEPASNVVELRRLKSQVMANHQSGPRAIVDDLQTLIGKLNSRYQS